MKTSLILILCTLCNVCYGQSFAFGDKMLEKSVNSQGLFSKLTECKEIYLLDTFNLFTPKSVIKNNNIKATVIEKHPGNRENLVLLANVFTEDSSIVLVFIQPFTGKGSSYYYHVFGNKIDLKRVRSGYY